jgi:hypothetical protein
VRGQKRQQLAAGIFAVFICTLESLPVHAKELQIVVEGTFTESVLVAVWGLHMHIARKMGLREFLAAWKTRETGVERRAERVIGREIWPSPPCPRGELGVWEQQMSDGRQRVLDGGLEW